MEKTTKKHKGLKIAGIVVLAAVALLLVYLYIPTSYERNNFKRFEGIDIEAMLAQQQSAAKDQKPLQNLKTSKIDIKYITKADTVAMRPMWLYLPTDAKGPVPVVYIPHYEMKAESPDLRLYIAQGWAVAAPADVTTEMNGWMTDDDLVFNNAALYTLRHRPEIDPQHIMLCGGSAGGYMTLMLDALQMGITASVANVPIPNIYYNQYQHFEQRVGKANSFWKPRATIRMFLGLLTYKNKLEGILKGNFQLPIPWVGMMTSSFHGNVTNLGDVKNLKRWEAFSPVALTGDFSSPFLTVHNTSDMLVPLNQTDSEHLQGLGKSIPKGFSLDLDRSIPGPLGHTFVEMMPKALTKVHFLDNHDTNKDVHSQFDPAAMFNINILNNGPVEAYGDHSSAKAGKGQLIYIDYMKAMMQQGLAKTERLMPAKLLLLLQRYQGKSIQLPAHKGIDDTVYGSLAVYQQEVVEELSTYASNHSLSELEKGINAAIATLKANNQQAYAKTWAEIKGKLIVRQLP